MDVVFVGVGGEDGNGATVDGRRHGVCVMAEE